LNTDAESYGGANRGSSKRIAAEETPHLGLEYSAVITLPPLVGFWLEAPIE
jgi:1,4-alpha-glucan branching enzyme